MMEEKAHSSDDFGSDDEEIRNVKPSKRSVTLRDRTRKRYFTGKIPSKIFCIIQCRIFLIGSYCVNAPYFLPPHF